MQLSRNWQRFFRNSDRTCCSSNLTHELGVGDVEFDVPTEGDRIG
ncbi:hypothetical protein QPK87_02790 [Kamptonema cortianum]|uniref:Uncharacterized protein n=1 Tax=Geitlerinema calcuttense NRMC-F 0142 TaxID=2922238 RepID=A0ABT7LWV6_9CYAN|nr:hypothetical protein [Geitlerinema calcuttense]MDK3155510.1 hypothetical protein [Kamptonema cortianum]MDL5047255.1 hypothetical protein [Oscillatoria amoena NRMC-F 0135]MDL5056042.1 hypothetical protein [Geitlerinema calcuttense NRMC-F 0142]